MLFITSYPMYFKANVFNINAYMLLDRRILVCFFLVCYIKKKKLLRPAHVIGVFWSPKFTEAL